MTNSDPSARDELVAAYLDGEATAAERAQVEADPELMARVEIMSRVAELVAGPVVPPLAEVRHKHIAEALAVSATAPNVTSIAKRRGWSPDYTRVLGAAAVILVVLFAGSLLLLNSGGGGDDVAATSADESANDGGLDGSEDVFNTEEGSAEFETESADADSDDAAEAVAADQFDAAAEPEEDPPAEEAAEDDAVPAPTAAEAPEGVGAGRFELAPQLDAGNFNDTTELAASLSEALQSGAELFAQEGGLEPFQCAEMLTLLLGDQELLLTGTASVGAEPVEYIVVDGPEGTRVTLVDTATCGIFDDLPVA